MMIASAIKLSNVTKKYGDFIAVDNLSIEIKVGEIYGFLGPNGAGKTTTILMILGLTERDCGEISVFGYDPVREPLKIKRMVGFMPENIGFYRDMTARESLRFIAALNGLKGQEIEKKIEETLCKVGLLEFEDKPVEYFSRGMRQRLGIAELLIKEPKLVIMDEPTLGLDPEGIRDTLKLIKNLSKSDGITVLLSSHLLYQVQEICDRVGIFSKGSLIASGTIEELASEGLKVGDTTLSLEDIYIRYFKPVEGGK